MAFLIIIFVLTCALLMVSILLQSGKGEGLSGTFGGTGQFMGGRAATTFLTKATTILATVFMLLCIIIGVVGRRTVTVDDARAKSQEVMSDSETKAEPLTTPSSD